MMTKKTPVETRTKLLQATLDLITEEGVTALTLEKVAHKAQVSKGGLLHHFPTKESLFVGLIEMAAEFWLERFHQALAQEPVGSQGRHARAYIHTTFERDLLETQWMVVLGQVMVAHPELDAQCQRIYDEICNILAEDNLPEARRLLIQVACDGFWLGEVAGLPLIPEAARAQVRAELLSLTV